MNQNPYESPIVAELVEPPKRPWSIAEIIGESLWRVFIVLLVSVIFFYAVVLLWTTYRDFVKKKPAAHEPSGQLTTAAAVVL